MDNEKYIGLDVHQATVMETNKSYANENQNRRPRADQGMNAPRWRASAVWPPRTARI
jgi:hypothetical protein